MRVLIVPDKFKGTLTAQQAAAAIARGWREVRPEDQVELLPMSDGGDGFGEILGKLLGAAIQCSSTVNAAHESIQTNWWWSETERTAIVESAQVIGLAMLPAGRFHPFQLDTIGLGQLLRQIAHKHLGCRLLIGIGGSATNDAGFGLARGLGYRFEDVNQSCIDGWVELDRLFHIRPSEKGLFSEVIIACDVQNPLLGPEGASRVYGPQKGLRTEDFPAADRAFERLAHVVKMDFGADCASDAGAGAAGGLGYGLRAFLNGKFKPGFDIFSEASSLSEKISAADLVITGEGGIDRQTAMGKGTGAVAGLAKKCGKRCIALAGHVAGDLTGGLFESVYGITPELTSPEEAKRDAAHWLSILSQRAARQMGASSASEL